MVGVDDIVVKTEHTLLVLVDAIKEEQRFSRIFAYLTL